MNFKKVLAIAATGSVMIASIAFAQVSIADLTASLRSLSAADQAALLAALGGSTATPSGFQFTRVLKLGDVGNDVKMLQQVLNSNPSTMVASVGAGSPGYETMTFGPATKAAVIKFQNMYASEVLYPAGLQAGTGYVGNMTIAKLNSLLSTSATTEETTTEEVSTTEEETYTSSDATEGSISVTQNPSPAAGTKVYENKADVAINAWKVKALDSDMTVKRVAITFTSKVWRDINKLSLWDGDTELKAFTSLSQDQFTEPTSGTYKLVFSGFEVVVPKGTTKVLTVKTSANSVFRSAGTPVTMNLIANGIRAVDTAGLSQYGPDAALSRTYTPTSAINPQLAVRLNTGDVDQTIRVKTNDVTPGNVVAKFDIESKDASTLVKTLTVTTTQTATDATGISLWDGETELANAAITAASQSITFSDLTINVAKDTIKTLTLKADFGTVASSSNGNSFSVTYASMTGEEEDGDALTAPAAASSKTSYIYSAYPSLAFLGAPVTKHTKSYSGDTEYTETSIQFSVTANVDRIYIPISGGATTTVVNVGSATSTGTWFFACTTDSSHQDASYYWVDAGSTMNCKVDTKVTSGSTGGNYYVTLTNVKWYRTATTTALVTQTWPSLSTVFKTATFNMVAN